MIPPPKHSSSIESHDHQWIKVHQWKFQFKHEGQAAEAVATYEVCQCTRQKASLCIEHSESPCRGSITKGLWDVDKYIEAARKHGVWVERECKALAVVSLVKEPRCWLKDIAHISQFLKRNFRITADIINPQHGNVYFLLNNMNKLYTPLISDGDRFYDIIMPQGYPSFTTVELINSDLRNYLVHGKWYRGSDVTKWLDMQDILAAKVAMAEFKP